MEKAEYILAEMRAHPLAMPEDAMKLCYQAAFGAEHLLEGEDGLRKARAYLSEEYASAPPSDESTTLAISPHTHRAYLAPLRKQGLPWEWLFSLFTQSAAHPTGEEFSDWISSASALAAQGALPFSHEEWQAYLADYIAKGAHPVHHSERYRAAYHPAYRVISAAASRAIPILLQAAKHAPSPDTPCLIAIDGRAASGKTTVATLLANTLGAGLLHMDDFFLPPTLRTEERLSAPGGNVHYERFASEILSHIKCKEEFTYKVFDCSVMAIRGERYVKAGDYRIVEGSYSLHPYLGDYADITVFSTVEKEEQLRRILARNGAGMARRFATEWIPMEEAYFQEYRTEKRASLVI